MLAVREAPAARAAEMSPLCMGIGARGARCLLPYKRRKLTAANGSATRSHTHTHKSLHTYADYYNSAIYDNYEHAE